MRSVTNIICAIAVNAMCMIQAWATPDEIQVYTDEMNAPGQFGLEQHLNYTIEGTKVPDYPGQMATHHVAQLTPEFSYGMTDTLEVALYLPLAFTPDGNAFLNGIRLRLKYIAPRPRDEHMFYGMNAEAGRDSLRTSESDSGMELRPIIGYRDEQWLLSFNPILNMSIASNTSHQAQFEPALKVAHSMGERVLVGLEYYGSYGNLNRLAPVDQRAHSLYAVCDIELAGWDVNMGIGRGFGNTGDLWVAKGIIAMPFR